MAGFVDREQLFRWLYARTDRTHTLIQTQRALSAEYGITDEAMFMIFREWVNLGRMKKAGQKFTMLDPDKFEWSGPEYEAKRMEAFQRRPKRKTKSNQRIV